ncbi:uncharacterized protein A1O9_08640 [Exophiala aquamarina CBS 119918]|uniref:Prion-inhibition and propagation HeLo domain-containing protein n=1 Tax=Exophiala aquamarina CBS 119918 TaxID=1182545 RepID=A0A072P6R5_9EURO|nr:uncharacterized protein A1O9_08640 [Exophiala aquamarina CBS 119918]KEF54988.1 hypothetical protein A1O9_08640 [Exophiala aquamarina CBS 119918]
MAEAAGLAIGAASLAGLFLTCIEYMECFNLDRNLGQDSEASVGKMMLLEAKLTAWGASLRVVEVGSVLPILRGRWNQEQETIGKALMQKMLLVFRTSSMLFDPQQTTRQQETSLWKKTLWAVRDKKKFDALIDNLAFYIDSLEKLSDRLRLRQKALHLRLEGINSSHDMPTQESAATTSANPSDPLGTVILDQAGPVNGNIGITDAQSYGHIYDNAHVMDDARAIAIDADWMDA